MFAQPPLPMIPSPSSPQILLRCARGIVVDSDDARALRIARVQPDGLASQSVRCGEAQPGPSLHTPSTPRYKSFLGPVPGV